MYDFIMKEHRFLSPAVVESIVLLNFVTLAAAILMILATGPTALGMMVISTGLVINIFIALFYGVFVVKYQPPIGKHLIKSIL